MQKVHALTTLAKSHLKPQSVIYILLCIIITIPPFLSQLSPKLVDIPPHYS